MAEEPKNDEGLSDTAQAMRSVQTYLSAAWRFVGACVVGCIGGYFIGKWLGSGQWGLIIGSFIGICAGFYGLVTSLNDLEKRKKGLKQ